MYKVNGKMWIGQPQWLNVHSRCQRTAMSMVLLQSGTCGGCHIHLFQPLFFLRYYAHKNDAHSSKDVALWDGLIQLQREICTYSYRAESRRPHTQAKTPHSLHQQFSPQICTNGIIYLDDTLMSSR